MGVHQPDAGDANAGLSNMPVIRSLLCGIGLGLAPTLLTSCNPCRPVHEPVCDAQPLGSPPLTYAEELLATGSPRLNTLGEYHWTRCDRFTIVYLRLNQTHTSELIQHYEGSTQTYSLLGEVDGSPCTPRQTCGVERPEVAQCSSSCLWWDYAAGTEHAQLPPGDPGWCEDSPWKDFVFEG